MLLLVIEPVLISRKLKGPVSINLLGKKLRLTYFSGPTRYHPSYAYRVNQHHSLQAYFLQKNSTAHVSTWHLKLRIQTVERDAMLLCSLRHFGQLWPRAVLVEPGLGSLQPTSKPRPLSGSKKWSLPNDPHYYIGETRGLWGGAIFLDPLGGLGTSFN